MPNEKWGWEMAKEGIGKRSSGREGRINMWRQREKEGGGAGLNACAKPIRSMLPDLEARFRLCLPGLTNTELESPGHLL